MSVVVKVLEILRDKHPIRRLTAAVVGRSGIGKMLGIRIKIQDYDIYFHLTGLCIFYGMNKIPEVKTTSLFIAF
jgi:hypothetical protein